MNSYYQNLLNQLVSMYAKGENEQADALVKTELAMPYIDPQAQKQLEDLQKEHDSPKKAGAADEEDLEAWIAGTPAEKEKAAWALQKMNLHQMHGPVQKLLLDPQLLQEFKGELIETLMSQRVADVYEIERDGARIEFTPDAVLTKESDPVYQQAAALLDQWFFTESPAFAGFCRQLLDQEVLEMRPFDFEGTDPGALAASIARLVFQAMKDEDGWERFMRQQPEDGAKKYPLLIEKRGDYSL